MRQITKSSIENFWKAQNFCQGNSQVIVEGTLENPKVTYKLFGNTIAVLENGMLKIYTQGYYSVTTKERLNGILEKIGFGIRQHQGAWYIYRFGDVAQVSKFQEGSCFYVDDF